MVLDVNMMSMFNSSSEGNDECLHLCILNAYGAINGKLRVMLAMLRHQLMATFVNDI